MTFDDVKGLSSEQFVRDVGISVDLFWDIRARILAYIQDEHYWFPIKKRGKKSKTLRVEDKLLLTFYYLRHYPTFDQLGRQFGISESYANKIFHQYLDILVKVLKLPGQKALLEHGLDAIIIDVTEQPVERPTKKQRQYYSGKKKRHTIKAQLVICLLTLQILTVVCGKGRTHDFKLLKQSALRIRSEVEKYGDSGYQGLDKLYANSFTPIKKKKETPLTKDEKAYNRILATLRIPIEHVNRRCKIFRSVKEIYRGKHKHYHKIWTVVAALVNHRYAE
jgi:hypothetical protein